MRAGAARPWLELIRAPAVFTAPADVFAGLAVATALGDGPPPPGGMVVLAVLSSLCLYTAGMVSNDWFDRAVDAVERPGRPIPSGRVSAGAAARLATVLFGSAGLLGLAAGPRVALAAAVTGAAVMVYNGWAKATPLGPWAMGACRYGNAGLGLSLIPGLPAVAWLIPIGTVIFVAGVTGLSRHEVDGAQRAALRWPTLGLAVGLLSPALWALGPLPGWGGAAAAVLTIAWLARPLRAAWRQPGARSIRGAVMAGIFAIALVNAQIAAAAEAWVLCAAILLPLPVGRLFGRWFYAT